jgi:hypothetical protein
MLQYLLNFNSSNKHAEIAFSSGHAAVPTFACFPYTTHAVMLAGNHPPGHQDPDFILV